ncbi:S1C family serine protease [Falsarthrobacter nasiphocae]|uniref:Serine protease PepD n=1 Tax=Falsarthrobacter nasiphocae TaxID=189863 RepID=A0AAE3YEW6_9MICC|nr:trypsin-like peptidase domain-containing protein [Falsarthrobacter nasiphocae]MDR6891437.1 putative serine protease PepD [Falsarthrobacter nasiphocae]
MSNADGQLEPGQDGSGQRGEDATGRLPQVPGGQPTSQQPIVTPPSQSPGHQGQSPQPLWPAQPHQPAQQQAPAPGSPSWPDPARQPQGQYPPQGQYAPHGQYSQPQPGAQPTLGASAHQAAQPQQPLSGTAQPQPQPQVKPARRARPGLVPLAVAALVGGLVGGGISGAVVSASKGTGGEASSNRVTITNGQQATAASAVAQKASPSVVTIAAISGSSGGSGSGIVLDKEGHILTNAHVVTVNGKTDGVNLQVRLYDNKVYQATLVGADPLSDIAVLKVDAPNLTPATLGDSNKINVGDMAIVIGSPLGLSGTVTDGIISTKSRTIGLTSAKATDERSTSASDRVYVNVIQTDAALNHGNSGGALVDGKGQVIGVNVAIASSSSAQGESASGIGFALPINGAKRIADSLIKDGKASHGYLGVQVSSQSPAGITGDTMFSAGALVNSVVENSPASKAGLKKGDVITSVDSLVVEDAKSLTAAVRTFPAGQSATLTILRDGKEQQLKVTVGDIPSTQN